MTKPHNAVVPSKSQSIDCVRDKCAAGKLQALKKDTHSQDFALQGRRGDWLASRMQQLPQTVDPHDGSGWSSAVNNQQPSAVNSQQRSAVNMNSLHRLAL